MLSWNPLAANLDRWATPAAKISVARSEKAPLAASKNEPTRRRFGTSHEVSALPTIDAEERLTQLLHMQERVRFHACSALELPFEVNCFDGLWSLQMNMNVQDKQAWLNETHRVLKPGGRAVFYEVCGHENTHLHFPVPWAQDSSMSFLVLPESFRTMMTAAGFEIAVWNDKTELAREAFANAKEPTGEPNLPILGVSLLVGNDIQTKAYNLRRNLNDKCVSLIESVAVKPSLGASRT